jgi:ABC-type Zn uptake system ZnuABC Zn-binding protein ZnuA
LQSVWGRLIYSYEFEDDFFPAVIVEAVDLTRSMKWSKKLDVDDQKELQRLKDDGHPLEMGKRFHEAPYRIENIRATQLYRTIPHEFGHYVHYLEVVIRPLSKLKAELVVLDKQIADDDTSESNPLFDQWNALDDNYREEIDRLEDLYHVIPSAEKEVFAHAYAYKFKAELTAKGIIPFDRILDEDELKKNGLNVSDF